MRSRSWFKIQASFDLLRITIIMTVEHDEENKTRQNSKYKILVKLRNAFIWQSTSLTHFPKTK